jgi:GxxExxY protein
MQADSRDPRTRVILAAAFEVHTQLGPGFEEIFYQRALAREFSRRNLDFGREIEIPVRYKGEQLGTKRIDFIVEDILLEIKATTSLESVHLAQALSYLRASGRRVGLLLNFGAPRLQVRRLIHGYDHHAHGEEQLLDG